MCDIPLAEQEELLLRKLRVCCTICDFSTEEAKEAREVLVKRQTLLDIREYLEKCTFSSSPNAYQMMCQVFALNVFRTLPPSSRNPNLMDEDMDEEPEQEFTEPSWPHLQVWACHIRFRTIFSECMMQSHYALWWWHKH
ncbi:unnamed protein product [Schistocephalus solidus]|uniref:FH2 domain-containing protein n=1 Tax=Schistocephalus solidus TaxID=70667 RepID=A0A183SI04_SCHSO|nr:unnamed protein product [Schistocephalus solidus]